MMDALDGLGPPAAARPPRAWWRLAAAAAAALLLYEALFVGAGPPPRRARPPGGPADDDGADAPRRDAVLAAIRHAWRGYEKYAWGADELHPVSLTSKTNILGGAGVAPGMAATIVDALSTLHLVGELDAFRRGADYLAAHMAASFDQAVGISFFEVTIRVLGGLLAAHDASGDARLLALAADLGGRLVGAFDGAPSGIRSPKVWLPRAAQDPWDDAHTVTNLAEAFSNVLEFGALAARTRNATFRARAEAGERAAHAANAGAPLLPVEIWRDTGLPASYAYTVGAPVDSYIEYLLKYWLLRGKRDDAWRAWWAAAVDEAVRTLAVAPGGGPAFAGVRYGGGPPAARLEHMACYFPGNVALGVASGAVRDAAAAARLMAFAGSMAEACFAALYNSTASGLGAEAARWDGRAGRMEVADPASVQRPELAESLFYLWRATRDPRYREWGWAVFSAIERWGRTPGGYTGAADARRAPPPPDDAQQSWLLAETLKYLWLLFAGDDALDLRAWVLNTEAHPLRVEAPPPA